MEGESREEKRKGRGRGGEVWKKEKEGREYLGKWKRRISSPGQIYFESKGTVLRAEGDGMSS